MTTIRYRTNSQQYDVPIAVDSDAPAIDIRDIDWSCRSCGAPNVLWLCDCDDD